MMNGRDLTIEMRALRGNLHAALGCLSFVVGYLDSSDDIKTHLLAALKLVTNDPLLKSKPPSE